jgi:hypothetical protein
LLIAAKLEIGGYPRQGSALQAQLATARALFAESVKLSPRSNGIAIYGIS